MPTDYAPSRTVSVRRQYHLIHAIYVLLDDGDSRVLRDFGLSHSQYRVLRALDASAGRRVTSISNSLLRAKSTITRIVDHLERLGLVERLDDSEDRRAQRVVLTVAGADLLNRAKDAHEQALLRRFAALDSSEQAEFQGLLNKLHDALVEDLYGNNGSA